MFSSGNGVFFFFKKKTAYEMRISDWSSDVCSSDLAERDVGEPRGDAGCERVDRRTVDADAGAEQDHERADEGVVAGCDHHGDHEHVEGEALLRHEIGRASCRERVCQYV